MEQSTAPHVLALPFPAEGHIKPMFNLAKLLCHGGLRITFVNSHHNHARLHHFTDLSTFHTQFPMFHFTSITDGVPKDHPRSSLFDLFEPMISPTARSMVALEFRELFVEKSTCQWQPPSCIIADGIMSTIAMSVAEEFSVPLITFRTYSATCTWVTIHISKLIQEGVVTDQDDMDKLITSIPGLENLLRDKDLPSVFRLSPRSFALDFYLKETLAMTRASALILNTFDQLEVPIISKLATIFPKVYTIGPLHTLLNTQVIKNIPSYNKVGCLRKEDRSCITWLDHHKPKSVLYVSFGTVVMLSHEELLEFWHGLVNSSKPFLWVIRQDLITGRGVQKPARPENPSRSEVIGSSQILTCNNKETNLCPIGNLDHNVPLELELGTKERGFVVDWAPQEEVLAHPSVGGFLTHSGWNSTLESISEGVPMLCWPCIADQTVNSRCVSEQWKIGLDMNRTCDMFVVEKMIRDVMENHREVLARTMDEITKKANDSVKENGSSYHNLETLIKNIRSMKVSDIE